VHSAGAKPRKNSFTFWQEKEAEKLEAERKAERERRFGDISRESYARLVIASNSIAKLSGRGSAGPSRGSSQQQQQQQQITVSFNISSRSHLKNVILIFFLFFSFFISDELLRNMLSLPQQTIRPPFVRR
jgi:hypothetical protein